MNEKDTPNLYNSGLRLDFEQLKAATDFSTQARLDENKKFANGMMDKLRKLLKNMDNNLFFDLLKNIIPLSIVDNPRFPEDYRHFAGSRLKLFNVNLKKVRKTPSKLPGFMEEEFVFCSRDTDTPRKKQLKKCIHELATTNKELAHISTQSQNELALLEEQFEEKENEIMSTTNKLSMLENDKLSLQQKIRGLKSSIARKKATHLFSSPPKPVVPKSVKTEDKFVQTQSTSSSKGAKTDIKNIQMNDIVIFDGKDDTDNKDAIFQ